MSNAPNDRGLLSPCLSHLCRPCPSPRLGRTTTNPCWTLRSWPYFCRRSARRLCVSPPSPAFRMHRTAFVAIGFCCRLRLWARLLVVVTSSRHTYRWRFASWVWCWKPPVHSVRCRQSHRRCLRIISSNSIYNGTLSRSFHGTPHHLCGHVMLPFPPSPYSSFSPMAFADC